MPYVCTEKYTIETDQKKVAQEHLVKKKPYGDILKLFYFVEVLDEKSPFARSVLLSQKLKKIFMDVCKKT
jgi:hypothetical protein